MSFAEPSLLRKDRDEHNIKPDHVKVFSRRSILECAGKPGAATPLCWVRAKTQSGVALCLPPHSKELRKVLAGNVADLFDTPFMQLRQTARRLDDPGRFVTSPAKWF